MPKHVRNLCENMYRLSSFMFMICWIYVTQCLRWDFPFFFSSCVVPHVCPRPLHRTTKRYIICEIFDNIVLLWQKFHQTERERERENSSKSCRTNWKCCKIIGEEIHLRCSPKTTHVMFKSTAFLIEQGKIIALWHSLSHARMTRRDKKEVRILNQLTNRLNPS